MYIYEDDTIIIYNKHTCVYEGEFGKLPEDQQQEAADAVMLFRLSTNEAADWLAILDY